VGQEGVVDLVICMQDARKGQLQPGVGQQQGSLSDFGDLVRDDWCGVRALRKGSEL